MVDEIYSTQVGTTMIVSAVVAVWSAGQSERWHTTRARVLQVHPLEHDVRLGRKVDRPADAKYEADLQQVVMS